MGTKRGAKKAGGSWRNRIVGTGEANPDSLIANPLNWRTHPSYQQEVVGDVLEEVGWIQDVIVNRRTAREWGKERGQERMIDGHLRVILAKKHKQGKVPVKYVDLTPDEERLALASLDSSTALAETDGNKLLQVLQGLQPQADALKAFLLEQEAMALSSIHPQDRPGSYDGMVKGSPEHTFVEIVIEVRSHHAIEQAIERARLEYSCNRGDAITRICEHYCAER